MTEPHEGPHRKDDVPEALRNESEHPDEPYDIGGPDAEPTGAWRVLRNSVWLAVIALALVGVWLVAA
ncbi:MAG: hypothetical protein ACQEUZ_08135 [Pseudomonadota bacterium]